MRVGTVYANFRLSIEESCNEHACKSLRIDADRLWQSLMDLARIGATPKGGVPHRPDRRRQGRP
jgi:hypothetical protein